MGTSGSVAPVSEWRSVTRASGAGGANNSESYAGISEFLGNFFPKLACLFRVCESGAPKVQLRRNIGAWDDDVDGCFLWESNIVRQSNLAILHDTLKCHDFHG